MPGIDVQGHAIFFAEMPQDGLFLGGGWIFAQCPNTAEGIAADKMVSIEFNNGRGDHVEKFLDMDILLERCQSFTCCFQSLQSFHV